MRLTRRRLLWPGSAPEVWPDLTVRPRFEWTESQPSPRLQAEEVRFLVVHHTAASTEHSKRDVPGILRGIRSFHVGQKGWPDIAYNFLIDRYGRVWEGRAGSLEGPVRGDATGGNQGFSQLVCLIGDFTTQLPSDDAQQSLVRTLAWLADRYGVDTGPAVTVEFTSRGSNRWPEGTAVTTTPIAGHRDMSHTACPGDALYPLLAERITPEVEQLRVPPSTTSAPVTTEQSAPRSAAAGATSTTAPTTSTVPITPNIVDLPTASSVQAAAQTEPGLARLRLPVLSVVAGAIAAVVTWRARRMGR